MGVALCPSALALFPRLPYNVAMKDKELKVKVDDEFIEKVDYLQRINDYKNRSDTVRKVVEKEYRKEVPAYDWTPFSSFGEWDDWERGIRLATIQNRFGQTFMTIVFLHIDVSKPCWYTKDIHYAENWKEGDFHLSHNWKVIALMPMPIPFKAIERKEKEDDRT